MSRSSEEIYCVFRAKKHLFFSNFRTKLARLFDFSQEVCLFCHEAKCKKLNKKSAISAFSPVRSALCARVKNSVVSFCVKIQICRRRESREEKRRGAAPRPAQGAFCKKHLENPQKLFKKKKYGALRCAVRPVSTKMRKPLCKRKPGLPLRGRCRRSRRKEFPRICAGFH